jgi:hypothetical protein
MEQRLAEDAYRKLNEEQKSNFDIIDTAIMDDPHSAHFFLQVYAGTGKPFLYYRTICHHFKPRQRLFYALHLLE